MSLERPSCALVAFLLALALPAFSGPVQTTQPPKAAAQAPTPSTPGLEGTTWRLVRFQGGDDTRLEPDERNKYTIDFLQEGRLAVRIDCNRGTGTWKSSGPSQVELGLMALTRAACPPGSLHDRIVKQWPMVRSYVLKDGHLFLSLMADGGIYEFEPAPKSPKP